MPEINVKNILITMGIILGLVSSLFGLDSRYARSKELAQMEQQTVQTFQQFKQDYQRDRLQQRYTTLTDQMVNLKILMKKYPSDQDLREDYNNVIREREKVKEQLDKTGGIQ